MTGTRWKRLPPSDTGPNYPGAQLKKHWARLHQGDCEPYPEPVFLDKLISPHPALEPTVPLREACESLQSAWRAYHRGGFAEAVRLGLSIGLLGSNVANKATNIYATYLETAADRKKSLFLGAAERAEDLQEKAPSLCNAWYFHAQALGRYSQAVSITTALAQGVGGRIKQSLDQALKLEPRHADAHLALAVYHSEIIAMVGKLIGSLTYGASEEAAQRNFGKALELNPQAAIVRIEHANGLLALYGKSRLAEARALYEEAARCEPADATENLDINLAKAELAG